MQTRHSNLNRLIAISPDFTEKTPEQAKELFADLISLASRKETPDQSTADAVGEFHAEHLSFTPNITDKLTLFEQITLLAILKRVPLLKEMIVPSIEGEVTLRLSNIPNPTTMADIIRKGMEGQETSQKQIDFLFGLNNILPYAQESSYAGNVEVGLEQFLQENPKEETFLTSTYKKKLLSKARANPRERRAVHSIPENVTYSNLKPTVTRIVPISSDYFGVFDANDFLVGSAFFHADRYTFGMNFFVRKNSCRAKNLSPQ